MHYRNFLHRARHRFAHAAAIVLISGAGATPAFAAPDWDMMGLKLGMTEAEVRAALQAYDAKGKIIASNSAYSYSDKVTRFSTPPFLNTLELRITRLSIETPLKVWFSGPIGDARAIAILRQEYNIPNPPTGEQFMRTLAGKYGEPSTLNSANVPTWEETGKPSCIWVASGANDRRVDFNPFSSNLNHIRDFAEAVAEMERRQEGTGGTRGVFPADLTTCGAFMYYTGTNNNPANHFMAAMFDVGAIIATHRARNTWVDGLETEAIRKREGQAQAPRL